MGGEIRGGAALEVFYRQSSETTHVKLSDYTHERRFFGDRVVVRESFTATIQPPGLPGGSRRGNPPRPG